MDAPSSPPTGFAHEEDYVLFGLLVRHGLCEGGDFPFLAQAQRDDFAGKPLLEILAEVNNLPGKSRANIQELLTILGTPKLRDLLPQDLPELRTLVDLARTSVMAPMPPRAPAPGLAPTEVAPLSSRPSQSAGPDDITDRGDPVDQWLLSIDSATRNSITADERRRIVTARDKDPLIGRLLQGHLILDQLGAGGQGAVYLAKQLSLGRYVALKRLEVRGRQSIKAYVDAFRREAETVARINHSRIVKIFDIFEQDGAIFFTMEHLQGKTLKDLVKDARGPLPLEVVANLACQACSALSRTAADDLVHRDIKPANMMLDENGDLKIVDFGLAGTAAELTEAGGGFSGTAQYAAPEQVKLEALTHLSDQYALGLTLYFALAGRDAIEGRNVMELLEHQITMSPPPPSTHNNALPRSVDQVIMRMLAKEPSERFPSFDTCFDAWQSVLNAATGNAAASRGTSQLLGEALLRLSGKQRATLKRNGAILVGAWAVAAIGALALESPLRGAGMERVLEATGDWGTILLVFSLSCIGYVAAVRRGWLPLVGTLRGWLYTHIATVIPSVIMLMLHSGNFLRGILPGGGPARSMLGILMAAALLITAASGSVGLLIFRELRRGLQLESMKLRAGGPDEREQMLAVLGARLLSGWRLVHYPLAIFFALLSILHIAVMIGMGG